MCHKNSSCVVRGRMNERLNKWTEWGKYPPSNTQGKNMPFVDHQRPNKKVLPYHHPKRLPVAPSRLLFRSASYCSSSAFPLRLRAKVPSVNPQSGSCPTRFAPAFRGLFVCFSVGLATDWLCSSSAFIARMIRENKCWVWLLGQAEKLIRIDDISVQVDTRLTDTLPRNALRHRGYGWIGCWCCLVIRMTIKMFEFTDLNYFCLPKRCSAKNTPNCQGPRSCQC